MLLTVASVCSCNFVIAQNVSINILTHSSGVAKKGNNIFLEITINNTSPADSVPAYKLRPQISIPVSIASIANKGHKLPEGWKIIFNEGGVLRLTNGIDRIPPDASRTILLLIDGKTTGGPSAISANLLFSSGNEPGTASGTATPGDNPSDNSSTTSIEVVK